MEFLMVKREINKYMWEKNIESGHEVLDVHNGTHNENYDPPKKNKQNKTKSGILSSIKL